MTGRGPRSRSRLTVVLAVFGALLADRHALSAEGSPPPKRERPNFVLIFVDDQGYQDVGCFGSETIRTPHLDRLAREGVRFTDFYALAPVCSASRAALLTGCYPPRVGITGVLFPRHRIGLHPDEETIADVLKTRGYATACVGKWHLGHRKEFLPTRQGFDSYFGIPYSNDMDRVKSPGKGVAGLDHAYATDDASFWNVPLLRDEAIIERPAKQVTLTSRYTSEAVSFIEKNREKPFFLYLAHTMPHIPLFSPPEFKGKSKGGPYGDVIEEIDASVGTILAALERTGLDKKTLVFYTSDNGPWLGMKHHGGSALPLRAGKFSTYEGGMRVPALARWPGRIPAGTVCREVAATFDLLPTFANFAGATLSGRRRIDGRDISGLLVGASNARSPHEAFYFYRGGRLEAVRSGRWKLRLEKTQRPRKNRPDAPPKVTPAELYDLEADIAESNNLAASEPEIVEILDRTARAFDFDLQLHTRPAGEVKGDTEPEKPAGGE